MLLLVKKSFVDENKKFIIRIREINNYVIIYFYIRYIIVIIINKFLK